MVGLQFSLHFSISKQVGVEGGDGISMLVSVLSDQLVDDILSEQLQVDDVLSEQLQVGTVLSDQLVEDILSEHRPSP